MFANGVPVHSGVPLDVVRGYDRETIELSDGVTWERLTPHGRAGIEFLEVTYEVNANSGPLASHYGEEFIHVRQGALEVEFAFNRVVLAAGDSLVFDSTVPHRVDERGRRPDEGDLGELEARAAVADLSAAEPRSPFGPEACSCHAFRAHRASRYRPRHWYLKAVHEIYRAIGGEP